MSAKDYAPIIDELNRQNWDVLQTSNGHYRAKPPDASKEIVVFAVSAGDHRSLKNTLADLRRSGFQYPRNGKRHLSDSIVEGREAECVLDGIAEELEAEALDVDALFIAMKEAREYAQLAEAARLEASAAEDIARTNRLNATAERDRAYSRLRTLKASFDAAFSEPEKVAKS